MALTRTSLELLADRLPGKNVLSLGYPDVVVSAADIERLLGVTIKRFTKFASGHGRDFPLPETIELFESIGARLECVDIHASRGVERVVDLNQPCELGKYDVVIDAGTIEHCFNIAQAMMNAANAVNTGGCIFHSPPMSMINHGFYNLSPTFFHDFYTQNGWTIELLAGVQQDDRLFKLPSTGRFTAPPETSLRCIAVRTSDGELRFPTQTKYLRSPGAA